MRITEGLFDKSVLQRNKRNVSEAAFSGLCKSSGVITTSVQRGGRLLRGFASVKVGMAARGKMKGCLKGLPVGGPYDLTFHVGDETLVVRDVLVGDVWLLGGQSNMQGCGLFPRVRLKTDPLVRAFYMDDRWALAKDPVHNMWECVDPVHVDLCGGKHPPTPDKDWGVCPGPAFGNEMRRLTGVPQGLIACAHGGTSMTQWDPKRKNEGGKSLYGAMIRRLRKNGGRVAGVVWYQGCSDATNADNAKRYTARMKEWVQYSRRDGHDKAMPVAMVQIARVVGWGADLAVNWNSIQEQQRLLPRSIRKLATVPSVDLALDDVIHVGGAGHYVLGVRLAKAMHVLREGRKAGMPPIEVKQVTCERGRVGGVVVVEFSNVEGRLRAGDRPCGFSIVTPSGSSVHFDIQLDGPRARIRTMLSVDVLSREAGVHYGYGLDPYCNITDEGGRSLPVFGPLPIGEARAITPYIRQLRVSAYQPSAGQLETLGCPVGLDGLKMTSRAFGENFCSMNPETMLREGRDEVLYFACRFSCEEAMTLALVLGYDGPVKAWVDGKLLMQDPDGINPATPDKCKARFRAAAGEHEIVVAESTNSGNAWGIYLRLQRLDVTPKQLYKGPDSYIMPEILG